MRLKQSISGVIVFLAIMTSHKAASIISTSKKIDILVRVCACLPPFDINVYTRENGKSSDINWKYIEQYDVKGSDKGFSCLLKSARKNFFSGSPPYDVDNKSFRKRIDDFANNHWEAIHEYNLDDENAFFDYLLKLRVNEILGFVEVPILYVNQSSYGVGSLDQMNVSSDMKETPDNSDQEPIGDISSEPHGERV